MTEKGDIMIRNKRELTWERIGNMEDENDAKDVAKFLQERDGETYIYGYVAQTNGPVIEV